jgi:hypothetical protein
MSALILLRSSHELAIQCASVHTDRPWRCSEPHRTSSGNLPWINPTRQWTAVSAHTLHSISLPASGSIVSVVTLLIETPIETLVDSSRFFFHFFFRPARTRQCRQGWKTGWARKLEDGMVFFSFMRWAAREPKQRRAIDRIGFPVHASHARPDKCVGEGFLPLGTRRSNEMQTCAKPTVWSRRGSHGPVFACGLAVDGEAGVPQVDESTDEQALMGCCPWRRRLVAFQP